MPHAKAGQTHSYTALFYTPSCSDLQHVLKLTLMS